MKTLYKLKLSMLLVALLSLCSAAYAQESVSGKVTDENGAPVAGANIVEKGTTNGTLSDAEGKYALKMSGSNTSIVITFIGYATQEIAVAGRATVDISLTPDVSALQEVVVTGYTSERKADVVAAISQVSALNTVAIPQSDIGQALQGRVAGVQVTSSGQPGQAAQVRIRGFGSFTNNNPLYVIDGVPTFDNTQVNPYDVETQTVLKDASAASQFGARAAAGVIVITTKHGKYDGKTNVTLDINTGISMPGNAVHSLSPMDQARATNIAITNTDGGKNPGNYQVAGDGSIILPDYVNVGTVDAQKGTWGGNKQAVFLTGPNPTPNGQGLIDAATAHYNFPVNTSTWSLPVQVVKSNLAGTNWYKALTRVAPTTRVSLGLSGGNDRAHYYANITYYDQQGIVMNSYLRRFSARLNSEFKPMNHVRVGENLMLTYRENPSLGGSNSNANNANGNAGGSTTDESVLNYVYRMPTIIPVHDIMGNFAGTAAPGFGNSPSPVSTQARRNSNYNQNVFAQVFGNAYIEIDPIKHLTLRSSFGGFVDFGHNLSLNQLSPEQAEPNTSVQLQEGSNYDLNYTWTNTARYDNKFGDHSLGVLIGYEAIKNNVGRSLYEAGNSPFSLDPNFLSISNTAASGRVAQSTPYTPYTFASLFGKLDYNYKSKYYLTGTVRRDGSSVFSAANRYGVFPAISAAWRISSEDFMQDVNWLTDLKIRGGYGTMGNTNALITANPANQFTLYAGGPGNGYDVTGGNSSVSTGFIQQQVGVPNGKWETSTTINLGLDATLFNGTFDVLLEFWQRDTKNLLFNPNILATGGVFGGQGVNPNNPYINVGSMSNKGIDLQLTKRIKIDNDWNITLDGNISPFKNKITAIASNATYFEPSQGYVRNVQMVRNMVGQPMSEFFGYQMIGYFNSTTDVANSPVQQGAQAGRFKYKDVNGDGNADPNDRVPIGSPIPKFTYGFNVNVKYKNWSLAAFLYGVYGNKIYNFSKWYTDFYSSFTGSAMSTDVLRAWTPTLGNSAKTPILESASNFSTNTQSNSWYLESGSYARLKNLQIGYDIPTSSLSKIHLSHLQVYVQALNLFTITKYSGNDPEKVGNVDVARGIDIGSYPATRQYMFGLKIGF